MVKPKDGFGKANMVRLWVHESLRVFGDRLVDDPDREWFLQHLNGMVSNLVMSACAPRISTWKGVLQSLEAEVLRPLTIDPSSPFKGRDRARQPVVEAARGAEPQILLHFGS